MKLELHEAVPLPCYPHDVAAAEARLEAQWAEKRPAGDVRHGTLYDGGIDKRSGSRLLIITFREL